MPYPLFIGQDAHDDMAGAWAYYESLRTGLGDLLVDELDLLFIRISEKPLSFPSVHASKRRAVLHKFKFNVFFTFDGTDVCIIAVMHGSRNPKRWMKR